MPSKAQPSLSPIRSPYATRSTASSSNPSPSALLPQNDPANRMGATTSQPEPEDDSLSSPPPKDTSSSPRAIRNLKDHLILPAIRKSFESNPDKPRISTDSRASVASTIRAASSEGGDHSASQLSKSDRRASTKLWAWRKGGVEDANKSTETENESERGMSEGDESMAVEVEEGADEACFVAEGDDAAKDRLYQYPDEILVEIFSYLDHKDILSLSVVSKDIAEVAKTQSIWRTIYFSNPGWHIYERPVSPELPSSRRANKFHRSRSPTGGDSDTDSPDEHPRSPHGWLTKSKNALLESPLFKYSAKTLTRIPTPPLPTQMVMDWPKIYRERYILEQRWLAGKSTSSNLIQAHKEAIYCVQILYDRIVTGSRDMTIKVWHTSPGSSKAPELVYAIEKAHIQSVLCLQVDPVGGSDGCGFLVSGSSDCTIGIWELRGLLKVQPGKKVKREPKKVRSLIGHEGGVLDILFNETSILSCSKDETIRIWSRTTFEAVRVLREHKGPVNCLALQQGTNSFVSAAGDGKIILWDLSSSVPVSVLREPGSGLACIGFKDGLVIYGAADKSLVVHDVKAGENVHEWIGHDELVRAMAYNPVLDRLCSASYDYSVKLWKMSDYSPISTCDTAHRSMVFAVAMDATKIVSASHDSTMAVQDFAGGLEYAALFA